MFRFEHPEYFYLLWILVVMGLLYVGRFYLYKKQIRSLGSLKMLNRLITGFSKKRSHLKFILLLTALLMVIITYTNPQWGTKKEKVKVESSDVFIALDISQSMMAEDVSPNRLERAKRLTTNIIQTLRGNRIGLIFFAGNAYLQMPLSNDYSAAQLFVASANTSQATTQGTAIGEAIDMALQSFESDKAHQRALIIITDGENHDDEAVLKATEGSEKGLVIFTVGVGTEEGGFVPFYSQGNKQYKRDDSGRPVKSSLNIRLIVDIAEKGRGKSYLIGEGNEIVTGLKKEIAFIEKEEVEQRSFSDYASYFQYFLFLGIVLLIFEFALPEQKMTKSKS